MHGIGSVASVGPKCRHAGSPRQVAPAGAGAVLSMPTARCWLARCWYRLARCRLAPASAPKGPTPPSSSASAPLVARGRSVRPDCRPLYTRSPGPGAPAGWGPLPQPDTPLSQTKQHISICACPVRSDGGPGAFGKIGSPQTPPHTEQTHRETCERGERRETRDHHTCIIINSPEKRLERARARALCTKAHKGSRQGGRTRISHA